ncbi:MAG: DUF2807 domain-containing protein [Alistipes sp.]|nr:DUF2807 domain-containing protein [Alistipes sp.]
MKRSIITVSLILISFIGATAQNATQTNQASVTATATEQVVAIPPKTDWLKDFSGVKVDGPLMVTFEKVNSAEDVRIVYDTKGCITSKFKAEINRNGILCVEEKSDPKRTSVTEVKIFYSQLRNVKISHAKCTFNSTIEEPIFDLGVSGGAIVSIDVNTLDLLVECTGRSLLTISGSTKYLTMKASSAKVDGSKFSTVASIIEVSNSSEVRINVSERLEATTSTAATLLYKGEPTIIREHPSTFGGDIININ